MEKTPTAISVVAAALIDQTGKVLLAQRPWAKHHGGLWEFPGGKVDAGETHADALVRELHEELGITAFPATFRPIGSVRTGTAPVIDLHLFLVPEWSGDPVAREHLALCWYSPDAIVKQSVNGLPMPPGDRVLAELLEKFS